MKTVFVKRAALMACLIVPAAAWAGDELKFRANLSGAQEESPVVSNGTGEIKVKFDEGLTQVRIELRTRDLTTPPIAAHFHCQRPGANGLVAFGIVSPGPLAFDAKGDVEGTLTNADAVLGNNCTPAVGRPVNNIAALAFAMRDGLIYVNVHTATVPSGEVRGQMLPD